LLTSAPAAAKVDKALERAQAMSPEDASLIMSVKSDPLGSETELSSEPFYQRKEPFFGTVSSDAWLRAFITRDGKTIIQLVYFAEHTGDWEMWNRGVLQGPNGPVDVEGHDVGSNVNCGRYGCHYREAVALDVPEDMLRWVASGAQAGVDNPWRFEIFGRYSTPVVADLPRNEVAGFMIAVDRSNPSDR
jgi:hypothetical protein